MASSGSQCEGPGTQVKFPPWTAGTCSLEPPLLLAPAVFLGWKTEGKPGDRNFRSGTLMGNMVILKTAENTDSRKCWSFSYCYVLDSIIGSPGRKTKYCNYLNLDLWPSKLWNLKHRTCTFPKHRPCNFCSFDGRITNVYKLLENRKHSLAYSHSPWK